MKTALPNWICACCLVIITLWVIEKRLQEVRLEREFTKVAEKSDRDFQQTKEYYDRMEREAARELFGRKPDVKLPPLPQPPKHSSEWSR